MWYYLHDPMFSRFDTIPECDRHTHTDRHDGQTHDDGIYRAYSITSRGKNCAHRLIVIHMNSGGYMGSLGLYCVQTLQPIHELYI